MNVQSAVRHLVNMSGKSHRQLAADMGKSAPTYVSGMINRGTDPQTSTFAMLARACGYRLQLVSDDGRDVVEID